MKNILQKTTLAIAIAATSTAALAGNSINFTAADAGHLNFAGGADALVASEGVIIMANEIFGASSENTLVATPDLRFTITPVNAVAGGDIVTVKLTLDKGVVFGQDLSDITKWQQAAIDLEFITAAGVDPSIYVGGTDLAVAGAPVIGLGSTVADSGFDLVTVTQGGFVGNNTVTFELTANAATANLVSVRSNGFQVKNLTSALERGVANPSIKMGAEYRNVTQTDTFTDTALTIFSSQDGVELDGVLTTYDAAGGRARIDVAANELSFTGAAAGQTGANAAKDFDATDDVPFVTLGTLEVNRSDYDGLVTANLLVKKEDANDFDFNGSDIIDITLTSSASVANYGSLYLRPLAGTCDQTVVAGDFVGAAIVGDANSVKFSLSGQTTTQLEGGYRVCGLAGGIGAIPESSFTAVLNVDYFNPEYTESEDTLDYGQVLRNGCQVTLFNLPNVNADDKAFIRFTNISELPGRVRSFIWTQDGQQIDIGTEITASLAAHATTIYSTDVANSGYIGTIMPEFGALTSQRHRIVLQGAFPACEALGLIKGPAGILTNMTATTASGDPSRMGDVSNTSNTSN